MNHFNIRARKIERKWYKQLEKGYFFFTGKGKKNIVVDVSDESYSISTEKSKNPFKFSRENVRKAVSYMLYKRTATRIDIERFSPFNSALIGFLRMILIDMVKYFKTVSGLLRLALRGMRYFFSGNERSPSDMEIVKYNGGEFILLSYYHLRNDLNDRWLYHVKRLNISGVLIDSGAFSLYEAQKKGKNVESINIKDYADFIVKYKPYGFFNLDVVGDPVRSRDNAKYLNSRGLKPIEVWHVSSSFEELERMIQEDHEIIGIGGSAKLPDNKRRAVFDELFKRFPKQLYHLLGGSCNVAIDYDFFQADGTTYLSGRKYGKLVTPEGTKKAPSYWSSKECLSYNVRELVSRELQYDKTLQLQMIL